MGVFTQKGVQTVYKKDFFHCLKRIGVSVLFSGAAIGVSHVVQATRAGGSYGLAIIPVILICLFLKYPAFLFGPMYTHITGESVIQGYLRINRYILVVVGLVFLGVMFTVVAAVSMLSAGILIETFQLAVNSLLVSIALLFLSTIATLYSSFDLFQKYMKVVFLALIILTMSAIVLALPSTSENAFSWTFTLSDWKYEDFFFVAALVGWMPAGLDLPMMHSQWLLAAKTEEGPSYPIEDFNFGYLSTAFLAVVFTLIGTVFFFGQEVEFAPSAGGFSAQLLNIYRSTIGNWAAVPIGSTLFLAIFSTLIVVIDGFPRVLSEVFIRWKSTQQSTVLKMDYRKLFSWVQAGGASILLLVYISSLTALVDFATVISFILAPLFAFLNHRLMFLENFKQKNSVHPALLIWSRIGITSFFIFTTVFIFLIFN